MLHQTRRQFIAGAGAAVAFLPGPALALSPGAAQAMVDRAVAEIYSVINSGKPERAMYADFEQIFQRYSDTSYIAAYAMGNDARRASAAQKAAFSRTFSGYVSRRYGKRFRDFIGGKIEVEGARTVKNYVEVTSTAYLKGEQPFDITWHVYDRNGKPQFFNLYIEGINMLLTERTEIGAMLDRRRGDIDAMIADLSKAG